jgi:iron complex outermembrane receptor protein
VNEPDAGSAWIWEPTPLFVAESVEVLRGPGSALYGQGAMSGVLSVKTLSPDGVAARAAVRVGDAEERHWEVLAAHGSSRVAALVAYDRSGFDSGSVQPDGSGRLDATGGQAVFPMRDGRSSETVFAKVEGRGAFHGLQAQVWRSELGYDTGQGWNHWTPDRPERLRERRESLALRWAPGGAVAPELALRLTRYEGEILVRDYPAGAVVDGVAYPDGATERLDYASNELFARAQLHARAASGAGVLGGAEWSAYRTDDDAVHEADFDVATGGTLAPLGRTVTMPGAYEPIRGRTQHRVGAFAQVTTGPLLGRLALTAGGRVDEAFLEWVDVLDPARPVRRRALVQLSPRLAAVLTPAEAVTVKAMWGRAFRAPAPNELFSAHTLTASYDPGLRPETTETAELAATWRARSWLELRANAWRLHYRNPLSWDTGPLANGDDLDHHGGELEALWQLDAGRAGAFGGFASGSVAGLFASEPLVRAPGRSARLGVDWRRRALALSAALLVQGRVARSPEDLASAANRAFRPDGLPEFAILDLHASWRVRRSLRLAARATNALDAQGRLARGGDLPFDYRVDARRLSVTVAWEP